MAICRRTDPSLRRGCLFAGLIVLGLSSCYEGSEPESELDVGVLDFFFQDAPRIELPDTVSSGLPFSVSVETYGNSCVRLGPTEVLEEGAATVVVPYDYHALEGPCLDLLRTFEHEAWISLEKRGRAEVIVRGRERPRGAIRDYPRTIWVR